VVKRQPLSYATVPRLLPNGGTVLVMGAGPSLNQADVDYARARVDLTIAVNSSYKLAPDATLLYAADAKWYGWHKGAVAPHKVGTESYPAFTGKLKYCMSRTQWYPEVQILRRGPMSGLSLDPAKVALGHNGVYQSINVAVHFGATKVVLLGVDMKGRHFHAEHPDRSAPPFSVCLERFASLVKPLADLGVEVWNCTPRSSLKCFPMASLEEMWPRVESFEQASSTPDQQTIHASGGMQ
jgi:hypothetical protein